MHWNLLSTLMIAVACFILSACPTEPSNSGASPIENAALLEQEALARQHFSAGDGADTVQIPHQMPSEPVPLMTNQPPLGMNTDLTVRQQKSTDIEKSFALEEPRPPGSP